MLHSPAEIIRACLVAKTLGVLPTSTANPTWPVFVSHLPETPDDAVCVYDTPGFTEGRIQQTGETIEKPGWQVRVRAKDHTTAWRKMDAIKAALDTVRNFDVAIGTADYTIASITKIGGVMALGQEPDSKKRNGFTLNGTITHKEQA